MKTKNNSTINPLWYGYLIYFYESINEFFEYKLDLMKTLSNITYNFGKFWLAIILFIAMIISTIVSIPFIVIGKLYDMWRSSELHTNKMIH